MVWTQTVTVIVSAWAWEIDGTSGALSVPRCRFLSRHESEILLQGLLLRLGRRITRFQPRTLATVDLYKCGLRRRGMSRRLAVVTRPPGQVLVLTYIRSPIGPLMHLKLSYQHQNMFDINVVSIPYSQRDRRITMPEDVFACPSWDKPRPAPRFRPSR